jgi:flavin reductase (DIM6/NTAB) family NADH-FMN oxidoreductase RutF
MSDFKDLDNMVNSLGNGAFLVSGDESCNVMTIGWGTIGILWFKPVFMLPVRQSRYTKEFVDKSGVFTVSIPYGGKLDEALRICGSTSGRDVDKFHAADIKAVRAKAVDTYVIEGCDHYLECRVLYKTVVDKDKLGQEEAECYADNDMHTLYFAEIVKEY